MSRLRKIIREIIKEELMGFPKHYAFAVSTTNFPYEEDNQEALEDQSEIIKMANDMGMEPSKGYTATTYVN